MTNWVWIAIIPIILLLLCCCGCGCFVLFILYKKKVRIIKKVPSENKSNKSREDIRGGKHGTYMRREIIKQPARIVDSSFQESSKISNDRYIPSTRQDVRGGNRSGLNAYMQQKSVKNIDFESLKDKQSKTKNVEKSAHSSKSTSRESVRSGIRGGLYNYHVKSNDLSSQPTLEVSAKRSRDTIRKGMTK